MVNMVLSEGFRERWKRELLELVLVFLQLRRLDVRMGGKNILL